MEKETVEQTAVLMDPCTQCNNDGCSLHSESEAYRDDGVALLSGTKNKGVCDMKGCNSWITFGLLCLLVGGLLGFFVRPYIVTRIQPMENEPGHPMIDMQEIEELHKLQDAPSAFKQTDNTNLAPPQHHVTENHTRGHTQSPDDRLMSKENTVISTAVKMILENMTGIQGLLGDNPVVNLTKDPSQRVFLSVGMRNDYRLQACGEGKLKQSFPDVDYAFFGYNILKGFPLAIGHDPGFTLPIFQADYSAGSQSADCRYSIPKGLVIVPDVSCVTSFSSEVIKTQEAYSSSLSLSVGVQGSVWGASFSASAGYKSAKSELENREKVYVLSTARCNYYFSKLAATNVPQFNPDFLQWIRRLESSTDQDTYIEFFNTYGTHFPVETTFGARYTYEHSMTTAEFESKEKQGIDLAMSASYSGLFSVGGSFGLNSEQEKMASTFSKNVNTKTVTVGAAPPADGDAMKWAAGVQLNPVPVNYILSSIENLFTAKYMNGMNIDYESIHRHVIRYKTKYRGYLDKDARIERCKGEDQSYFVLDNTRLLSQRYYRTGPLSDCLDECFIDDQCKAISFSVNENECRFYTGPTIAGANVTNWRTYLLRKNNTETIEMVDTVIDGTSYGDEPSASLSECENICRKHDLCFAFSYTKKCRLFKKGEIKNAFRKVDSNAVTKFVSKCVNVDVVSGEQLTA